jgi:hypothetical protein
MNTILAASGQAGSPPVVRLLRGRPGQAPGRCHDRDGQCLGTH